MSSQRSGIPSSFHSSKPTTTFQLSSTFTGDSTTWSPTGPPALLRNSLTWSISNGLFYEGMANNVELPEGSIAIVIGAARRICSLKLKMDPGSSSVPGYIETAQRRGLLFHTRDNIPIPNAYALTRYDSQDAWERIEALEQISIISIMFASIGSVTPSQSKEHFRFDPYFTRPPPTKKFPPVERRRSTDLAYLALHARHAHTHQDVKAPFRLLSTISEGSGAGNFSEKILQTRQPWPTKLILFDQLSHIWQGSFFNASILAITWASLILDIHSFVNRYCFLHRSTIVLTRITSANFSAATPLSAWYRHFCCSWRPASRTKNRLKARRIIKFVIQLFMWQNEISIKCLVFQLWLQATLL